MKLHELEISNYKCLENYGMPLKFSDLNIFIGDNDSGKTSLFEVLQILSRELAVDESMFFNRKKNIRFKAMYRNIEEEIINKVLTIQQWDMDYYRCISNISKGLEPDVEDFNWKEINFAKLIEKFKKFGFYEDLVDFYKVSKKKISIILEEYYKISKIEEHTKEPAIIQDIWKKVLNNSKKDYGIYQEAFCCFDISDKKLSEITKRLIKRQDFNEFMQKYLNHFWEKCDSIIIELLNNYKEKKFSLHSDCELEYLADYFGYDVDEIIDKNSMREKGDSYWEYLDFIKSCYASIIFSNDSEEDIYSKIAYLISAMINKKSFRNVPWDFKENLKYRLDKNLGYFEKFSKCKTHFLPQTNILGNYIYYFEDEDDYLPIPRIYNFESEVVNKEIPNNIFYNLVSEEYIINFRDDLKKFMIDESKTLIKNTIEKIFNSLLTTINNELALLSEDTKKITSEIKIENLEEIFNSIEFKVNIYANENNQKIDITNKGQGFLRKLQIAEFLYLLDMSPKDFSEFGLPFYGKDRILLIEEPEIHLHVKGQEDLIKGIRTKLKKRNNQVFLSTHSHYMIKGSQISDIYVFTKDKNTGISTIDNIKQQITSDKSILSKLENTLGLSTTDILFMKKLIIIVEGKHDIAFIRGLFKHPKVNISPEEILFIEAKGQTNIEHFIGLGAFLKIKVLVIFDKNKWNINKKEKLLKVDKFKNRDIMESLLEINVLDEPDILNYLEPETLEKYYGFKKGSLNFKKSNSLLKNLIYEKKNSSIKSNDVEFFASQLNYIKKDISKKILEPVKRFYSTKHFS